MSAVLNEHWLWYDEDDDGDSFTVFRNGHHGDVVTEQVCDEDWARLIAAAPDMARMLLREYKENVHRCEPDCELIRVLRKAGVLPSAAPKDEK